MYNKVNHFRVMHSTTAQELNAPYKRIMGHLACHYRDSHKDSYEKPQ